MNEDTFPMQSSRYYAAVILNELSSPSPSHQTLYEEEIVLILADSEANARELTISHAKAQEDSYQNQYGETITHRFKAIKDIRLMPPEIGSGTTVYSRFFNNIETYEAFDADTSGQAAMDVA
jgi:hypothetical protein